MGLPKSAISLLLHEAARVPYRGTIATLGRQHVYATADEVRRLAARYSVQLQETAAELHRDPQLASRGYLSDESLFQWLHFSSSVRVDLSNYERVEEELDLNQPETPPHLRKRFDVVLDSGTIEHVFDIANALRHCARLVRAGGRVIHLTPTSNSVDHGFYSVSPTLFRDFYETCGFEINKIYVCQLPRRFERRSWRVYDYLAGDVDWLPLGRLDGCLWFTFVVATAGDDVKPAEPQQRFYRRTWMASSTEPLATEGAAADWTSREPPDTRAGRLLSATRDNRLLFAAACYAITTWRSGVQRWRDRRRGRIPYPYLGRF